MPGGSGNDVIHARDGEEDTISCGAGHNDRVTADTEDHVGRSCEHVTRR